MASLFFTSKLNRRIPYFNENKTESSEHQFLGTGIKSLPVVRKVPNTKAVPSKHQTLIAARKPHTSVVGFIWYI